MEDKDADSLLEQLRKIPLGDDQFPLAGDVIMVFRIRKGWTQAQLGKRLEVSKVMVHNIEKRNVGLDLPRRRLLSKMLDIPPILLGLGTLEQLHDFFRENEPVKHDLHTKNNKISTTQTETSTNADVYKHILQQYHRTTLTVSGLSLIGELEVITQNLVKYASNTKDMQEKKQFLILQWEFHRLAAKICADFQNNTAYALRHVNSALSVASQLHDTNLLVVSYAHIAALESLQGNVYLARPHIDAALSHAENASDVVKCDTYALAARLYQTSAQDYGTVKQARSFIELSQGMLSDGITRDGRYLPVGVNESRCGLTQFHTLLKLKNPLDALDILEVREKATPTGYIRRQGLLHLNRAKCYQMLKYPGIAVQYLSDAFSIFKEIGEHRNIENINKMLQQIRNSSYGNGPDVQELELVIRDYQTTKKR